MRAGHVDPGALGQGLVDQLVRAGELLEGDIEEGRLGAADHLGMVGARAARRPGPGPDTPKAEAQRNTVPRLPGPGRRPSPTVSGWRRKSISPAGTARTATSGGGLFSPETFSITWRRHPPVLLDRGGDLGQVLRPLPRSRAACPPRAGGPGCRGPVSRPRKRTAFPWRPAVLSAAGLARDVISIFIFKTDRGPAQVGGPFPLRVQQPVDAGEPLLALVGVIHFQFQPLGGITVAVAGEQQERRDVLAAGGGAPGQEK